MKTRVSSKGQIVLPAELRRQDDIEPGQEFEVERLDRGDYRLTRRSPAPNEGALDWLLGCPEMGLFAPSARSGQSHFRCAHIHCSGASRMKASNCFCKAAVAAIASAARSLVCGTGTFSILITNRTPGSRKAAPA
jgi:AbrB family looped-hinge helix DNA binding protein